MKLLLKRIAKRSSYTIGKLYINGQYFCDTLEDTDRGLTQGMSLQEISKIKVKDKTAIPTGIYSITLNIISPKFGAKAFYKANANGGKIPRLQNVPGYEGILIHCGNTDADTSGCILVGENREVGKVLNSQATFRKLYQILDDCKEQITIQIV